MLFLFRSMARTSAVAFLLLATGFLRPNARAQNHPHQFREFLSQYTGREILLINMSSDSLQFFDADSTQRFVVVLDEVGSDVLILHRANGADTRSFAYPIADIRRVTYLFGGRRYRRIVVETF
jgi:hypothetical protein